MNFEELSDDELVEKQTQLMKNYQKAVMWGSSHETVKSLENLINIMMEEKDRRELEKYQAMIRKSQKDKIITDLEVAATQPVAKTETVEEKPKRKFELDTVFHKEYTKPK